MSFKIGQKIICIDDKMKPESIRDITKMFRNWIKKDEKYTIRAILENDDIVTGILLEEVVNGVIYIKLIDKWQEPAFALWRFRVLDEFKEELEEELEESLNKEFAIGGKPTLVYY